MKLKLILFALATNIFSFAFGQIKLEDLDVDTTITGFHFAANFQGTTVFTKHGPSDIQTVNPTAFSFTVVANSTSAIAKNQINMLLQMSKRGGYTITDFVEKDTAVKGNIAYYVSYIETNDTIKYKNFVFNAFVNKDNTIILFTGGDLDNGQYIDKFRKTFYSIKL